MTTAYIALGSNLEQPDAQLQHAVCAIGDLPHSCVTAISSVYRSTAVGPGEQDDYLNAVLALETTLRPAELLDELQALETRQGRIRTVRWGPRTLDLDILLYGNQRIATPALEIPHPQMAHRHFVLYPLAEIAGTQMMLPCGTELGTLLAHCSREDLLLTAVPLDKHWRARP